MLLKLIINSSCVCEIQGKNENNKQLLDEVEHDIMNYQNRGLFYVLAFGFGR